MLLRKKLLNEIMSDRNVSVTRTRKPSFDEHQHLSNILSDRDNEAGVLD